MLFRIYVTLYGGSVGIAMALVARLARTKPWYEPEHLPLEFGSFVAASGFLSGALIAFLTTWVARGRPESTFSRIRFILMAFTFGFLTGFLRGFVNPIIVSSFDIYKGFLTFKESLDMISIHLFNAPITLADLHYQTPVDFQNYAKKLSMSLKWRTIDRSWAHGEILIRDFQRRLPNVLRDAKLPKNSKNIENFLNWLKVNVTSFDNTLPHSGATGLYVFSLKTKSK